MKKLLLIVWLIAGAGIALWYFGPGTETLRREGAAAAGRRALHYQKEGKPDLAASEFQKALALMPAGEAANRAGLRIGLARAQLHSSGLTEARADMESLVGELSASETPELLADARATLAETQYYNTWLLRLEGAPREIWEPEIESARQIFRNLAESPQQSSDTNARAMRNLESAVRLARMEITELQALPIPKQCKGCRSCKVGKKPKKQQQKPEDARTAGGAIEIDNSGD